MSSPRIRLHFPAGRPLDLADVRLALFGTLWAHHDDGTVVASIENRSALDDLEWLGIEPDEMAAPAGDARAAEVAAELIEEAKAYQCYCTQAEFREMPVNPSGFPETVAYDLRCRRLTPSDRASLEKMGRSPRVRLILPEELPTPDVDAPAVTSDFPIVGPDGHALDLFSAVLSPRDAGATALLVDGGRAHELAHWLVVAQALDWEIPQLVVLPAWIGPDGKVMGKDSSSLTVASLRAQGFHPKAIVAIAARAGWNPGDLTDIDDMAKAFDVADLTTESPVLDMDAFRTLNGEILRGLDESDLVQAVGEHLERRGYPFMDRDPEWQQRFVRAARKEMTTLADAEGWAALLLTATADYDREVARVLREPSTQELVEAFAKAMAGIEGDGTDANAWRGVLSELRTNSSTPGRAMAILRLIMTGQREGPGVATILSLLGIDGCQARIEKARRYTG
ncbi:MAG: hypothetical protein H6742_20225 [Alphaproteobacteria bacterium]|nr:hypothetical protein [Alphaproteobacteria bacterium]